MNTTSSMPLRTLIAGAILTCVAFSFSTVSSAEDAEAPPQVVVKSADLDISTPKGAEKLYRRIREAADNVCSRMYLSTEAYRLTQRRPCMKKVIADTVTKVNDPALSAIFAYQYGVSAPVVLAAAGTR